MFYEEQVAKKSCIFALFRIKLRNNEEWGDQEHENKTNLVYYKMRFCQRVPLFCQICTQFEQSDCHWWFGLYKKFYYVQVKKKIDIFALIRIKLWNGEEWGEQERECKTKLNGVSSSQKYDVGGSCMQK